MREEAVRPDGVRENSVSGGMSVTQIGLRLGLLQGQYRSIGVV